MFSVEDQYRRDFLIPPRLGWTIAILCIAAGTYVAMHFGKPNLDRARASTHWPTTDGQVEKSEVGSKTDADGKRLFFTRILYSYSVDGERHESKTVWVGDDFFSSRPSSHEETVQRYPVNAKVTVHYDPDHPEVAVLEPGLFASNYGVFIAGLGLVGCGAWIAFKTFLEGQTNRCRRR